MTVDYCLDTCSAHGYEYAGLAKVPGLQFGFCSRTNTLPFPAAGLTACVTTLYNMVVKPSTHLSTNVSIAAQPSIPSSAATKELFSSTKPVQATHVKQRLTLMVV